MQQIPLYDQLVAKMFYAVGDWSATGRRLRTIVFCDRRNFLVVFSSRQPLVSNWSQTGHQPNRIPQNLDYVGDWSATSRRLTATSRQPVPTKR